MYFDRLRYKELKNAYEFEWNEMDEWEILIMQFRREMGKKQNKNE